MGLSMRTWTRSLLAGLALSVYLSSPNLAPLVAQVPAVEPAVNAKTWVGKYAEFEEYLRTAEIDKIEDVGMGVTRPRRAYFKPGGLFESMAWKPLKPGVQRGYWESYKAEIAAYEIDKLLQLRMVPPAVERRVDGELGAAIMWVSPTRMWKQDDPNTPAGFKWMREIVRMKMLDDFIGNIDRNAGNLLVDPAWNLILIDHSRALTPKKELPAKLGRIDRVIWDRMNALTEESLTTALGQWMTKAEIKGILDRRQNMKKEIDGMVSKVGEAGVYLPNLPETH
jgi:hypothetical protein